jgi:hypothetical protein
MGHDAYMMMMKNHSFSSNEQLKGIYSLMPASGFELRISVIFPGIDLRVRDHRLTESNAGDPPGSRQVYDSFTASSRHVHDKFTTKNRSRQISFNIVRDTLTFLLTTRS